MPLIYAVLALAIVAMLVWFINARFPASGNIKPVVNVVLALIVVGVVLWLINTYIPMAGSIKTILNIVVVIATCVLVLQALGLWSPVVAMWSKVRSYRMPRPAEKVESPSAQPPQPEKNSPVNVRS